MANTVEDKEALDDAALLVKATFECVYRVVQKKNLKITKYGNIDSFNGNIWRPAGLKEWKIFFHNLPKDLQKELLCKAEQ